MSSFSGIELGKRGLSGEQLNMTTAGHNLSNMHRKGYTKQRVRIDSAPPLYREGITNGLVIGQGTLVRQIERVKSYFLEAQIDQQLSSEHYWKTRGESLQRLEAVFQELDKGSLRDHLDLFWQSWQELSRQPESMGVREIVKERALGLIEKIHQRSANLISLQRQLDKQFVAGVNKTNSLLQQLELVQKKIQIEQGKGANPNDLLDTRDSLVRDLSQLMQVYVEEGPTPDRYNLYLEGQHLMQGAQVKYLQASLEGEENGYHRLEWADARANFPLSQGELAALTELRQGDIEQELKDLNKLTATFADVVNGIHREAYGLDGQNQRDFFHWEPVLASEQGFYDSNQDGVEDSLYLFRLRGQNLLRHEQFITQDGQLLLPSAEGEVTVTYSANETVGQVLEKINHSSADVVFSLDYQGYLNIRANPSADTSYPDFVIRSLEDSGGFLSVLGGVLQGTGPANRFEYQQLESLSVLAQGVQWAVTPEFNAGVRLALNTEIATDISKIAAGFAEMGTPFIGDNRAALAVASLRTAEIFIGKDRNFDEYLARSIASVGARVEVALEQRASQEIYLDALYQEQQSIEGVSMDEELADMIKFRNSYAAISRFLVQYDALLETLLSIV